MLQNVFQSVELADSVGTFNAGMNSDPAPLLLPKNQLQIAVNLTFRGAYAKPRPKFQKLEISDEGKLLIADALSVGPFQGVAVYNPDSGDEYLVASIAGRLFSFEVLQSPIEVIELTIPGDPNPSTPEQVWMWQAEKWLIVNDGISLPLFYDGVTTRRSTYNTPISFSTENTNNTFIIPAVGSVGAVVLSVADATNITVGTILSIKNFGTFLVQTITLLDLELVNLTGQVGKAIPVPAVSGNITWTVLGQELPPGRMGVYGMGRNWICLVDGKQFVASDLVGGSSGTVAENYRDSVLNITENNYLAGGGNFAVPGSIGDIRAMIFTANLDASLGQGPLQVFTHSNVFSCQAPVDRLTWQDLQSPILTQSLIGNGALGQNNTVSANSDIIYRSPSGIASLILARREFQTWGNVPISAEVQSELDKDAPTLLRFGSSIVWDNRLLMTARPTPSSIGVYHRSLVALNFDPISSLRGKQPSIYDGMWTGLNILQMVTGEFQQTPRAFAFTYNSNLEEIEIYELGRDSSLTGIQKDNDTRDITCEFHTASLFNYPDESKLSRELKRLIGGEIYVDSIPPGTTANFQAYYRPDQWPCWIPWHQWSECAGTETDDRKPQFRPRMGLGEPDPSFCDDTTNRPLREGFTFQFRLIFSNCKFLGARFKAVTVPQQQFAPMICNPLCDATT